MMPGVAVAAIRQQLARRRVPAAAFGPPVHLSGGSGRGGALSPSHILPFCLLAGLAAVLMLPAMLAPPMRHDSFWIDAVWSEQFSQALREGNPYPRWLPLSYGGLGSPAFYFYAPLSFHLAGLFALAGLATYPALLAAFGTAWFGSGATMYLWLKDRTRAPLVGALVYMVLPYHVIDFYGRGALAEFCAFALVPLIAHGVAVAAEQRRPLPLAIAYAALIMTHLPTAVIVSVLLIAPQAILCSRLRLSRLRPVAYGVIAGPCGAALYLVPALTLQRHSALSSLWSVPFLKPTSWSLLRPDLWNSTPYVLLFAGLAAATALATALLRCRSRSFWPFWTVAICAVSAGLIPGFWSLPVLSAVQFPWRTLLLGEFGLATVLASCRTSPVLAAAAVMPLLSFAALMLSPANPLHGESMRPLPIPGLQDVIEYLPSGAVGPRREPRPDVLARAVAAAREHPGVVFPFPSLRARCAGGALVPLQADPGGALVAAAPPGCQIGVEPLPAEKAGAVISLLTWTVLLLLRRAGRGERAKP